MHLVCYVVLQGFIGEKLTCWRSAPRMVPNVCRKYRDTVLRTMVRKRQPQPETQHDKRPHDPRQRIRNHRQASKQAAPNMANPHLCLSGYKTAAPAPAPHCLGYKSAVSCRMRSSNHRASTGHSRPRRLSYMHEEQGNWIERCMGTGQRQRSQDVLYSRNLRR